MKNAKGELEEASWGDALARVKDRMGKIIEGRGGKAVAAIVGTNVTNEAAYLVQKFMRTVVGSNNVDAIDHAEQVGFGEGPARRPSGWPPAPTRARISARPTPSWWSERT